VDQEPVYVQLVIEYSDQEFPDIPHVAVYHLMDYSPGFPHSNTILSGFENLNPVASRAIIPTPDPSIPKQTHYVNSRIS